MNSSSGGSHLPVFRGAFRVTNGHNYRYFPLRILLRRHFTAGSHHSNRPSLALVLVRINAGFASGNEATFLHYSPRGWIVNEVAADERLDVRCLSDVV